MKPFLISLFIIASLFLGISSTFAAPTGRYEFNLWPVTTNTYELGTSTLKWYKSWVSYASTTQLSADSLCLNSDTCRTTWPSGSGSPFPFTATSYGVSTSTTIGLLNGFLSTASSTINSTFNLPTLSAGGLGVLSSGLVYSGATTTFSTGLTYLSGAVTCDTASGSVFGCLSSANWTTFNNKLGSYDAWTHPSAGVSATTSSMIFTNASSTFTGNLNITGNSTTTNATTTNLFSTTASSTNLFGAFLNGFALSTCDATTGKLTWASGSFGCGTDFNTGTFPFTPATTYSTTTNSTTTPLWMRGSQFSFFASSTSVFDNASTSLLSVSGEVDFDTLTSALILTGSGGVLAEYTGTTCTNQFVRILSALGVATCATVGTADVAGLDISDDTNLAVTSPITLTGDTIGFDFGTANTWTGANIFNNITRSTTTQATSTNFFSSILTGNQLSVGGSATTTINTAGSLALPTGATLTVTDLTSALTLTGAGGIFAEYTGTSCTNQFPRSLSALGVATCATVVAGDVDLADLTATNSTLTFSGTYDGQTARTIGINLANPNTWTGLQTITNASTTNLTAGTFFQLPTGTAMTGLMEGSLFHDTTSDNLLMGTTTASSATAHVVVASATTTLYAFAVASTSPDLVSGGIIELPAHHLAQVAVAVICKADAGTSVVINLSNIGGTSDTNTATCTTTSTQFNFTSNNSFAAYAAPRLEVGTVTGAVDRLSIRVIGYRTSD